LLWDFGYGACRTFSMGMAPVENSQWEKKSAP